jgi:HlyD family secretion protein
VQGRAKPIKRVAIALALLAALGTGLYLWLSRPRGQPDTLVLYGDVDIREELPAFNDSGRLTSLLVEEGAVVKRGELLATIDDTRYAASLARAIAQMRNQREVLAKLLAGSRPQEIAAAKATMRALRTTSLVDGIIYRRNARLIITHAVSQQNLDEARAAFHSARHQYQAARQQYLLALIGPRSQDIAAARAAYQASVAAVALARRELHDTRLYASSDGVVEDRILEPGDMASPGTPVLTIALPSPLWVRAYVSERDLGRVRLGEAATVTTDSYPGRIYRGWVGYLSPTAEFTPKTVETPQLRTSLVYQLRVYVCDPRGELRLGMPATVHIDLRGHGSATGCEPGSGRSAGGGPGGVGPMSAGRPGNAAQAAETHP